MSEHRNYLYSDYPDIFQKLAIGDYTKFDPSACIIHNASSFCEQGIKTIQIEYVGEERNFPTTDLRFIVYRPCTGSVRFCLEDQNGNRMVETFSKAKITQFTRIDDQGVMSSTSLSDNLT